MRIVDMDEDDLREWIKKRLEDLSVEVVTSAQKSIGYAIENADNRLKKLVGEIQQASDLSLRATDALDIIAKGGKIFVEDFVPGHNDDGAQIDLRISGHGIIQGGYDENRINLTANSKYRVVFIIEPLE